VTPKVADNYLAEQLKEPPPARLESSAKPVSIADERLAQYAGLYWKKDEENAVRIMHKDGRLFLSESEEESLELWSLADNRFQLVVFPVTFTSDEGTVGSVRRLSIPGPGQEDPDVFEAVTAFRPTLEQLRGYQGSFVSEEIEPVYRIVLEDGSLVLKRVKSEPQKLRPTLADYFEGPNGDLHFQRDAAGNITGFFPNPGRIKNSRFTKTGGDR
jgi:hypothetical protein